MKKIVVNTKYDFVPEYGDSHIDYSEMVTVPDQVLSMYDIYMKYAVRGEIAGLANNVRPHVHDDLDFDDPSVDFVPEEDLDILQRSRELRSRPQESSHAASEHTSVGSKEPSNQEPTAPANPDQLETETSDCFFLNVSNLKRAPRQRILQGSVPGARAQRGRRAATQVRPFEA